MRFKSHLHGFVTYYEFFSGYFVVEGGLSGAFPFLYPKINNTLQQEVMATDVY